MTNKIEIAGLKKSFKREIVLHDVNVNFEAGKIHGIIGRNGSGKTVLFKLIAGFLIPDTGNIRIDGLEMKATTRREMGVLIEKPGFLDHLSAMKNLSLLASIRNQVGQQEIREAISAVGLDPDEPMSGLDKSGVADMRKLFLKLKEEGVTILLSSHYAEDIDALCDTVCEMDRGYLTLQE